MTKKQRLYAEDMEMAGEEGEKKPAPHKAATAFSSVRGSAQTENTDFFLFDVCSV